MFIHTYVYKSVIIHSKIKHIFNNFRTDHLERLGNLKLKQKCGKATAALTSKNERNQLKKFNWSKLDHGKCYGKQKEMFLFLWFAECSVLFFPSFSQ